MRSVRPYTFAALAAAVFLTACSVQTQDDTQDATPEASDTSVADPIGSISIDDPVTAIDTTDPVNFTWSAFTDPTQIPVGTGNLSRSPQIDSLYSCQTTFGGRGAPHGGPWIDEATATWDAANKPNVVGSNSWPQATYVESVDAAMSVIEFSNLPTDETTGDFPIAANDPAFQYDRNPNAISQKTIELRIPAEPVEADSPSCVAMGPIGVLQNGVFLYNALDAAGADAVANEVQDVCGGHPDGAEAYHYHDISSCLLESSSETGSTLIGYALDGYGIYIERDSQGNLPTNADLDACHGHTSTVLWNGVEQGIYHYSATTEYPYTVGCFSGTPTSTPPRN